MFLVLFHSILVKISDFPKIQFMCDRSTDRPKDQQTDIPFYRDTRMHLKSKIIMKTEVNCKGWGKD